MANTDFNNRVAQPPRKTVSKWMILLGMALGLLLVPLAFSARVVTEVVLEPGFGPDAYYYFSAAAFAAGFHLLLCALAIVALAHRFRQMMLNVMVLELLIGYGLASVMFATIIT